MWHDHINLVDRKELSLVPLVPRLAAALLASGRVRWPGHARGIRRRGLRRVGGVTQEASNLGLESLDASEEFGNENIALGEGRFKLGDAKIAWVGRLHTQLGSWSGSAVNNSLRVQARTTRERLPGN
jgi:hypothetical protein